ncbi:MAG TPA: hypothetical protein VGS80_01165 [Ktedonobacterales bacterium]|jgi:hypothetical protein|nr:hypothetical protein [Ktedonobacterales bacterium]
MPQDEQTSRREADTTGDAGARHASLGGEGVDAPSHPETQSGQEHAATKRDVEPAGKGDSKRRDLDAEKREPVQSGSAQPYQGDTASSPTDRTHGGGLSTSGGSAGSGGGGADILHDR